MNSIRGFVTSLMLFSVIVIIFEWSLTGEAPHPGGGSTTIYFTDMYGSIGKAISEYVIFAWVVLIISFLGFILTLPVIRRLLQV